MLISIALLPVSVQASEFDDITLQIMDADTVSHNINNIDFSLPEVNMPDDNILSNSPLSEAAASMMVGGVLPPAFDDGIGGDLPGEIPDDLPPLGDVVVPVDPNDFPEDVTDQNLPNNEHIPIDSGDGIGGGLPGDLPPKLPDNEPAEFPVDTDG